MPLILGIDTGGTYTDAVVIDPRCNKIIGKAKSFTTKNNLMEGICSCIDQLNSKDLTAVKRVCLSTTLATNAVVEGRGGRAGLLMIGSEPKEMPPTVFQKRLQGKLDIKGRVIEQVDAAEAKKAVLDMARRQVDAVAISGYASVRNPAQELEVKRIVEEYTENIPVVCAHELTSSLGYDDRTVTVVLNARLIPIINDLIRATEKALKQKGIDARIMVVKGDGSLVKAQAALNKPIETILSGPAASINGGLFLTGVKDALIVDIGGTTTDIACASNGEVKINDEGASVGGWFTHVRASEMYTCGIGGDSYIRINKNSRLDIGPERVEPLCVAGVKYPYLQSELKEYSKSREDESSSEQGADCFSLMDSLQAGSNESDRAIEDILKDGAHSLSYILKAALKDADSVHLSNMVSNGKIQRISATPTDVLHVLNEYTEWNEETAAAGLKILAEKSGKTLAEFAETAYEAMIGKLTEAFFRYTEQYDCKCLSEHAAIEEGDALNSKSAFPPIIALGAPAKAWMPDVCKRLNSRLIIPEHYDVSNAVGAAVGLVKETVDILIRPGRKHKDYIIHAPWERRVTETLQEAIEYVLPKAKEYAAQKIIAAGCSEFEIQDTREDRYSNDKKNVFIETRITLSASGTPDE